MPSADPAQELRALVDAQDGHVKIRVSDLLRRFGRQQPSNAALHEVSAQLRQAGLQSSPMLTAAHPTGSVLLSAVPTKAPIPKARRWFRLDKEHLYIAAAAATVLGASASIIGGLFDGASRLDPGVEDVARRYIAFAEPGEFSAPREADKLGDLSVACLDHVRDGRADNGRYELCLVIDPAAALGNQVSGSYKRPAGGGKAYDCTSVANTLCE